MNYLKEIAGKNKIWICIYISLGIGLSFLSNYNISFFQKLIDKFTDGTLSLPVILVYGGLLLLLCLGNYLDEYPMQKLNNGIYLDLKLLALYKTSRIDYLAYQSMGTGKLIQRVENGAMAGKNILCQFWFRIARELLPSALFSLFFYLPPEPCDCLYSSLRLFTGFSYYQFIAEASVPDERKSSG